MAENIKVSIVMPVYNAVKYIDTALQSIIAQNYNDFELLIIDDGATDGTGEICKKYSDTYENIRYYKQTNGGTCVARNKGIELALGKYIAFSDHDDEYLSNYLEVLMKLAEDNDLDVVKCGVFYEEEYPDGSIRSRREAFDDSILTQDELVHKYNELPISFFGVWNSLYKTSILKENNIFFPETIRHGQEDYYFNTDLIKCVKKVGFSGECLYKHFRRLSQSTSAKFYDDRIDAMSSYFKRECSVLEPIVKSCEWPVMYSVLYARKMTGVLSYIFSTLKNCPKEKSIQVINYYIANTPFKMKIDNDVWKAVFKKSKKYFLVLRLTLKKQYKLLILFWKLKNK